MSKYSEAAGLPTTTHGTGKTAPAVSPASPEPVTTPDPIEDIVTSTENPLDSMPVATNVPEIPPVGDFKWMSKIKLEEIGRTVGIELDRRLSQPKLVEQLEEHIANMNS